MAHRVKWLIVFLVQNVHEVEEDTKFMDKSLEQLLKINTDMGIGIAGCISTTAISPTLERELSTPPQGEGKVHSFVVRLLMGAERRDRRLQVLEELPSGKSLTEADDVVHIFRTIRKHYEYEHVLLTTWDHGSGFAIFAEPDKPAIVAHNPAIAGKAVIVRHPIHNVAVHRLFRLSAMQKGLPVLRKKDTLAKYRRLLEKPGWISVPYGLTMDKLRSAILAGFGKVDVLFMRNCFMQTFDTGFILHDVVDYLVACESIMWFEAYDYSIWLKALEHASAPLTEQGVAATAILGFTQAKVDPFYETDTALFGNDLSFYPALNYTMDLMIRELIFYAKGNKGKLLECRRKITDIVRRDDQRSGFQLVDARYWFEKVGAELLADNAAYQDALKDFLVLHKRTVGGRLFVGRLLRGNCYDESGFSLYFPAYAENVEYSFSFYAMYYALHSPFRSEFTRSSLWDEFIGYLFLNLKPHLLRR
jgi:Clostripain family